MNEVTVLLEQLATKLGTTVEYLWGVLIQQTNVEVVKWTILLGVTIILSVVYGIIAKRMVKFFEEKEEIWPVVFWIFGGCIVFGFWVGILSTTEGVMDAMMNPEYWALQEILTSIR